jgi:hypothetical protein
MALIHHDEANGMIEPGNARLGGILSLAGAAALVLAPILYTKLVPGATAMHNTLLTAAIVLAAILAVGSVQTLRRVPWGQSLAVGTWIAVGCAALLVVLMSLLGMAGEDWPARKETGIAAGILLALAVVETVLVHRASEPGSRQRYASTAMVTTGEVVALLLVVNIITQTGYVRLNAETLGRFGLSDRTRRVLENVDDEITLTCVYTASQDGKEAGEYRTRVLELLEEMEEFRSGRIGVENITTDGGKAKLMARLAREREQKHAEHLNFVQAFQQSADDLTGALEQDTAPLLMSQDAGYLDQWRLRGAIGQRVGEVTQEIENTRKEVARNLQSGVIEYGQVVSDANDTLTKADELVATIRESLLQRSRLPQAVRETAPAAIAAVDKAIAAAKKIPEALIDPNGASIEQMQKSAANLAEALRETGEACQNTAGKIEQIGGELFPLVYQSDSWLIRQMDIDRYYLRLGRDMQQQAAGIRRGSMMTQADELRVLLRDLSRLVDGLPEIVAEGRGALQSAVASLTQVDEQTQALFEAVRDESLMTRTRGILRRLTSMSQGLSEPDDSLADELASDNIVLLEVGDRKSIVPFDEVWPMVVENASGPTSPDVRRFNGDAAIASALLDLVRRPFAKVYLTHFAPPTPPQMHPMMQRMMPQSPLPPDALSELQERLEEANFLVETWNLTDPAPWIDPNAPDANAPATQPVDEEDRLPKLLVVCPPAIPAMPNNPMGGQTPQFGPEHLEKVRTAIDGGTGAIFLTHFHSPRPVGPFGQRLWTPPYPYTDYLKDGWGIEPLNEFMVFPATRDPEQPDRLTLNIEWFSHMPLNAFTDHPVGKPLQGRRTLWRNVCPVVAAETVPEGVSPAPLLRVPATMDTVWASSRVVEIFEQVRYGEGSTVTPDFDEGDMRPPFPVAMAATRAGTDTADSRVVVLGMAMGLSDGYLDEPVLEVTEQGGTELTDPPSANADLVINSCLWLTGWDQYIASGPAYIQPIEMIEPTEMRILWAVYVVGIPAIVLVIGAVAMGIRRRQ